MVVAGEFAGSSEALTYSLAGVSGESLGSSAGGWTWSSGINASVVVVVDFSAVDVVMASSETELEVESDEVGTSEVELDVLVLVSVDTGAEVRDSDSAEVTASMARIVELGVTVVEAPPWTVRPMLSSPYPSN